MLNDGRMYIFGGQNEENVRFSNLIAMDPGELSWKNALTGRGQLPAPRAHHTAACLHGRLVIFGGYGGNGKVFGELLAFDPGTLMWSPTATGGAQPRARFDHTMSVAGDSSSGHMVLVGGRDVRGPIDDVCVLDIAHNVWCLLQPLSNPNRPIGLYNHSAVAVKTALSWKIFLFGGCTGLMEYNDKVHCYDTESESWVIPDRTIADDGSALMKASEYNAVALDPIKMRVLVLGGWADRWLPGMAICSVQAIVGPTYAVTGVSAVRKSVAVDEDGTEVTIGPLSGGQELHIHGTGRAES